MEDTDPWTDTAVQDWAPEAQIRFSFTDDTKTIPAAWAQDMLCRWHKRNPGNFGNELAKTSARWVADKFGDDDK